MNELRKFIKNLPTFLTALAFALAVWIFAVSQADPTETQTLSRPLEMDVIGQNPNLMVVNDFAEQVTLTLRAPSTVLNQITSDTSLISVTLDLSGLDAGWHSLTPQVSIDLEPVEVVRINPASIIVELDAIVTERFTVEVETTGDPAVGFEANPPELSAETVRVSGPESLVSAIHRVVAEVSIEDAAENIQDDVNLVAYDNEGAPISDLILNPETIMVSIPITQRGGYRTVGIIPVTSGDLAAGYRQLNIFAIPSTVTVYSSSDSLVQSLPSSVETTPININDAEETMEIRVTLDLPEGVTVVGSQYVTVRVEIEPIIDSRRFSDIPLAVENLGENLNATLSPENVDVILEGPVALLDALTAEDIIIIVDLTDLGIGTHQVTPEVQLDDDRLTVESILPSTVEVTIN
jgi:YbbR domain-containing protein